MAALIRHCTIAYSSLNKKSTILTGIASTVVHHDIVRHKSQNFSKKKKGNKKGPLFESKWEWNGESLSSRGFLRPLKAYTPTGNISERLSNICQCNNISPDPSTIIDNFQDRYKLFIACEKEFNCSIPNSVLHTIETIGDVIKFYETPINTTLPLDATLKVDLPKNLHIQHEYVRFNPETDTKFGGKTAFPKSSTLVTGIKYKKKYRSLILSTPFE